MSEPSKEATEGLRKIIEKELNRRVLRNIPEMEHTRRQLQREGVDPIQIFAMTHMGRFFTQQELESGELEWKNYSP